MVKNGRTVRLIRDQVGSVRLVVDVETGEIVQRIEYDSFGRVLSDTNPGFQPFGFGGGLYDPDTGLVRFGLRDYDSEIGRWTNLDPIGFAAGINLYAYCRNDPINFADPWGLGRRKVGSTSLWVNWLHELNPFNPKSSIRGQFSFDPARSGFAQIQGAGEDWVKAYEYSIGMAGVGVGGAVVAGVGAIAGSAFLKECGFLTASQYYATELAGTFGGGWAYTEGEVVIGLTEVGYAALKALDYSGPYIPAFNPKSLVGWGIGKTAATIGDRPDK